MSNEYEPVECSGSCGIKTPHWASFHNEQPRPAQASGAAAARPEIWTFCARGQHEHCTGEAQLTRTGPLSKCGCDCHKHDDAPAAPERGEWRYVEVGHGAHVAIGKFRLSAHWQGLADSQEIRDIMRQIVREHNQHSTLAEQQRFLKDRIAAQTETMAKVVHERNELRGQHSTLSAQRERLLEALRDVGIRLHGIQLHISAGTVYDFASDLRGIRDEILSVLTTIEQEGTRQ